MLVTVNHCNFYMVKISTPKKYGHFAVCSIFTEQVSQQLSHISKFLIGKILQSTIVKILTSCIDCQLTPIQLSCSNDN